MKVYLAGQWNDYDNNWKDAFKRLDGFLCVDPEVESDQSSPDTFFPDDLKHINNCEVMVANPSTKPSEATWAEIGYFYALNTLEPGERCEKLIIIWKEEREPKWSKPFIDMMGHVVSTFQEAEDLLMQLK